MRERGSVAHVRPYHSGLPLCIHSLPKRQLSREQLTEHQGQAYLGYSAAQQRVEPTNEQQALGCSKGIGARRHSQTP
jgi:hypothetical protein